MGKINKTGKSFIELLRSETNSGVMVPVVIADMNNDGIDDIIVSLFDATVTVLDGQTLEIIWTTDSRFQGLQFYTTPALGYFNDDDVLDLMISMSYGKYPVYNLTMHVVLDGENGDILWNLKSSKSTWSSPLTLQTGNHKDAFLFWVQGRQGNIIDYELKDSIGRVRRHGGKEEAEENDDDDKDSDPDIHEQDCDVPEAEFISEMLLMNRNTIRNPIRVVQENSVKHMYSVKYSNVLGMGQEDMDKMRLKMQNSTDEQKMNMTIKMINQVKALSESDERIVTDVMNHISEEDLAKLRNHVMEFLGGVLKSGDDIYTVMTHHVMHHVLHMEESHGGDGDMPSSSAEGEPDSHPEGMPNEHGHGHAHNDDMPMGGEHGHNDDDMPMAGQHSHDDDMPMGAGEHHDDDDDDMPMAGQHSHDDMPMGGGKHHDDDMPMVGQHSHDDDMPMGGGKHHGDDDDDDDMPMASPENTDSDSMPMQPGKMPIDEDNIPMNSEAKPDLQEPAPEPSSTVLTPRINGTDINSIKLNSSNTNNTAAPPLISEKHTTPKLLHRYKKPLPAYPHRLPYTKYKLPGHSRHARHGGSEEEHGDMGEMEETISEIIVNPNGAMCARMVMDIKPTGAVGMVDGQLNYFFLENWIAYYRDFGGSIKGGDYKVIARKINLNTAIQQKDTVKLDKHLSIGESIHSVDTMDESEESFSFLPNGLQSWLSYMGGNGDGHFKHV
uniref:Uncharacterized protein LOC102807881 n=1 Tax=Saccoglossus kowalevskii TaxID=10224 RepID=A0ABM0MJW3_SACKO|nr:PREDICTED: uncharacterized protein LOC102807881 [Saccoglossus kowalevskii]